jgi:tetratricopeptide (TPR) repeat protein
MFSCTKQVDKIDFTKQQYELDINKYIEHSMTSNQIDTYTINVKEQLFFSIEIEQKEIDIKIALDTIDNNLLTIDNIKAKEGKELLSYILNSGTYKVRISSPIKKQTKGAYKLIAKLRVPNETDIKSFTIQQSMIEAENLRNSGEEILIEKAERIYSESLEFYKLVNNKEKQMEILSIMGLIQFEKDNKEKSLDYYRDALKIAETSQDFHWIGKIFNAIGDIYFVERDMEVARFYFERGLEKRRRCGDINGEAESINNIGSVEWYTGENQKALDEYNKALSLLELTEDNVLKGIVNHNIGSHI